MADLDAKLWAIINHQTDDKDRVAAIHKAFEEHSNWKLNVHTFELDGQKLMTGQEWYEKFVESLDNEFHFMTKPVHIDSSVYYDAPNVMKAAKKAAGLEG
jgi:hypothetical protein